MKDAGAKIGFFMAGLGIGAIVAVLYTPKTGKETRRLIAQKAGEGRDYLETQSKEMRKRAEDAVDRSREFVSKQKDRLAEALRVS